MRVAVFNTRPHDEVAFATANAAFGHPVTYFESPLNAETVPLANGYPCVCASADDLLDSNVVETLASGGTRLIALRCSGLNHVDLAAAWGRGLTVVRVPACSPHAVAEHTLALILTLSRGIPRAYERVKDGNPSRNGLVGLELNDKTAGIIGTGSIGRAVARFLEGFGGNVLGYDLIPNLSFEAHGAYVAHDELLAQSDLITLHCPLTPDTYHFIGRKALKEMKDGIMLINTSRGALLSPTAVLEALKSGKLGYLGLDLYEEESDLYAQEQPAATSIASILPKLMAFPNVVITNHQGQLTQSSLNHLAVTTLENITEFERTGQCRNAAARITGEQLPRAFATG